jgi:NAD-dependent dihydropyrimidine dehydrogenase PreA subunit
MIPNTQKHSAVPSPRNIAGTLKFNSETEAADAARHAPNEQAVKAFDIPVIVDGNRCIKGCHICVESCPVDCLAIHPVTGKAHMKYDECWYCLACEVDCPTNAITVKIPFFIR